MKQTGKVICLKFQSVNGRPIQLWQLGSGAYALNHYVMLLSLVITGLRCSNFKYSLPLSS